MKYITITIALAVCACTTQQEIQRPVVAPDDPTLSALSAGPIGCPPTEIRISEYQRVERRYGGAYEGDTSTWSAKCRGKQFYCTGARITQCREALAPAP